MRRSRTRLPLPALLVGLATASAFVAWIVLSPVIAAAIVIVAACGCAVGRACRETSLSAYAAACDRARSSEPPWWPDFERQFWRECRRSGRMSRRHR